MQHGGGWGGDPVRYPDSLTRDMANDGMGSPSGRDLTQVLEGLRQEMKTGLCWGWFPDLAAARWGWHGGGWGWGEPQIPEHSLV